MSCMAIYIEKTMSYFAEIKSVMRKVSWAFFSNSSLDLSGISTGILSEMRPLKTRLHRSVYLRHIEWDEA